MPFIPVPQVCQAELIFRWDNAIVENVHHFSAEGPFTTAEMVDLGEFLISWWDTNFQTSAPTNLQLINVRLTDLTTETSPVVNVVDGLPLVGSAVAASLPNNVTCVFTKRTQLRGRSFRGRTYHIGLNEAEVTGNTVGSGTISAYVTNYNYLRTFSINDFSWELCVVSRYADHQPRAFGLATPVLTFTSDGIVDSQRRRLPGRGN